MKEKDEGMAEVKEEEEEKERSRRGEDEGAKGWAQRDFWLKSSLAPDSITHPHTFHPPFYIP